MTFRTIVATRITATALFAACCISAHAVFGINADLDVFDGNAEIGNGAPSDLFGGAANQPGRWNRLSASYEDTFYLLGLSG